MSVRVCVCACVCTGAETLLWLVGEEERVEDLVHQRLVKRCVGIHIHTHTHTQYVGGGTS
jgi:hypothetical protein